MRSWTLGWMLGSTLGLLALPALAAEAGPQAATAGAVAPLGGPLSMAGEGRRLFLKLNCYSCHGMGATGGMGPNIVGRDLDTVRSAVLGGREGGMPSFAAYVDDKDIRRIARYLGSIGTDKEPFFNDWWVPIPPK
ncbi:MAG TPA: cytochrome c [Ideonella sp.]|nr:cytochrome c [Ideonella sp.]